MVHKKTNVLKAETIKAVRLYAEAQTHVRTNHRNWGQEVVALSGPIYLVELPAELAELVCGDLKAVFTELAFEGLKVTATHTSGGRLSFIPWHEDHNHKFAVTVYLNDVWHKDWGGYFLYEQRGEVHAVLPQFNSAVGFECPLQHCTTMPNINAPLRESIQLFFDEVAP